MACIAAVHVVGPSQWPSCAGVRTCRVSERQHAHLPLTPTQAQGRGARHAARRAGRGDSAPCALHRVPCTRRRAPCTLHPAPCTLHPAPCTLHPTPYTLHPTPYTLAGARRAPRGCGRALRRSAAAAAAGQRLRAPCTPCTALRTASAPPLHRPCTHPSAPPTPWSQAIASSGEVVVQLEQRLQAVRLERVEEREEAAEAAAQAKAS